MPVQNGLYRVQFTTPMGQGFGVLHLVDGILNGGDSMMAYSGTYEEGQSGQFKATAHIFKHSDVPGYESAIGSDDATLEATGTASGDEITLTAPIPGFPAKMQVAMKKIA